MYMPAAYGTPWQYCSYSRFYTPLLKITFCFYIASAGSRRVSAEFCPLRYHLMLVKYDRDQYSSKDVLNAFGAQKLQARLIGPI